MSQPKRFRQSVQHWRADQPAPLDKLWNLRKASSVQHGHTPVQQTIYTVMWAEGRLQPDGSRIVQVGYEHLARLTGLHKTTISRNLRSLQVKFSIEALQPANPVARIGTTYRVNSYRAILERRREARLDWISRPGHFHPGPPLVVKGAEGDETSGDNGGKNLNENVAQAFPNDTGLSVHKVTASELRPTDELGTLQAALWEYVRTNEDGHRLDSCPTWTSVPPDEVIVRRIARVCGDQFGAIFGALKGMKRAAKRAELSYGWFLTVLPAEMAKATAHVAALPERQRAPNQSAASLVTIPPSSEAENAYLREQLQAITPLLRSKSAEQREQGEQLVASIRAELMRRGER